MFSDKLALWMLLLPLLFWQFMGLINLGGVVGCVISEGPGVFVGLPNVVKAWSTQVYALFVGNYLFFAGEFRQGRILMQRRYTLILVDSEALEARWYCSIVNFQLHLALILLFHLLWEFFEGKTPAHNTIMFIKPAATL